MACNFKCGTRAIPVDSLEMSVSDLGVSFEVSSVSVGVRQPTSDSDIITAYVCGEVSADGFKVAFSSPVPSEGYYLDFTIFSEGGGALPVVDGDSLAVSYEDLFNTVATFLGYDPSHLADAQTAEIDSYIQSGVRNFYYPPKIGDAIDENFEWSFIRMSGSVDATAGVADFKMPDGFGRVAGQIAVVGDEEPMLPVIPYGDLMRMRTRGDKGRPRFAAFSAANAFGERGQEKYLHLYPTPDKDYTLNFLCDSDTGKISKEKRPFPLGGAMFSELVTESCLAVAEQRANDEEGLHTRKFAELLVSSIARDRKSSAQDFGDIGDPEARCGRAPIISTRGFLY